MEEPSEETCDVAFHVFNRYGTVKTKYKDHPVQRGTGVWGNELDHGPLFLIKYLHVTALELRRKGLGQKITSLLLKKAKQFCLDERGDGENADLFYGSNEAFERAWTLHALVSPGILTTKIKSQLMGKSAEERLMTRLEFNLVLLTFGDRAVFAESEHLAVLHFRSISTISLVPLRRLLILTRVEAMLKILRTKNSWLSMRQIVLLR